MIDCPDCARELLIVRARGTLFAAINALVSGRDEPHMVVHPRYARHYRVQEIANGVVRANHARFYARSVLRARLRERIAALGGAHPSCPLCGCLVGVAHTSPGPVCDPCAGWYERVAGRVPATLEEAYRLRQGVPLPEVEDMMDTLYEDSEGWLPGHIPVSQQASLGPQYAVQPGRRSRVER